MYIFSGFSHKHKPELHCMISNVEMMGGFWVQRIVRSGLEIATDTVAHATSIFSLAT